MPASATGLSLPALTNRQTTGFALLIKHDGGTWILQTAAVDPPAPNKALHLARDELFMNDCPECDCSGCIKATEAIPCSACDGSGKLLGAPCICCDGDGSQLVEVNAICDRCDGVGQV
jgi:hypothetical protein